MVRTLDELAALGAADTYLTVVLQVVAHIRRAGGLEIGYIDGSSSFRHWFGDRESVRDLELSGA
jgi:hypothetical protein